MSRSVSVAANQALWVNTGKLVLPDAYTYFAAAQRLNVHHVLYRLSPGDIRIALHPPYWSVPILSPPFMAVIWRPLENPRHLRYNQYSDHTPRGFGLLQRDRNFDHYQDDGVFYERRPGVWVEPRGDWGAGGVVLVELPTADETFDNIVAFWHPATAPTVGDEVLYAYRLHWGHKPPVAPGLATVAATRTGIGGVVGNKRQYFSWRFAIDFAGGKLPLLADAARVDLKLEVSRGTTETTSCRPLDAIGGYRAIFDLVPDESSEPINIKLYLQFDGVPLSETWVYQYSPPPLEERRF